MKISDSYEEIDVYAIYWIDNEAYFYGLSTSYDGLLAYKSNEVEIIDPKLTDDFVFKNDGIFYSSLLDEELLEGVVEGLPDAFKRFKKTLNLKS